MMNKSVLLASLRAAIKDMDSLISGLESEADFYREKRSSLVQQFKEIEGALDFQAQPTTAKTNNSPASFLDAIKSRAAEDLNKIKAAIQEEERQKKIADNAEQYKGMTRRAALIRFFITTNNHPTHITKIVRVLDKSYNNISNALSIYPEFQSDGNGYWNMKPDFYRAAWTKVGK